MGGIMGDSIYIIILNIFIGIGIYIIFVIISIITSYLIKKNLTKYDLVKDKNNIKKADFLGKLSLYILLFLFSVITISFFNFNISFIMSGIGFGLGYITKDWLLNMIGGAFILGSNFMKIGDVVELPNSKLFAKIKGVNSNYSTLVDINERKTIIYNNYYSQNPIITYSREKIVRRESVFNVNYGSDLDKIFEITKTIIISQNEILEKASTYIYISKFGICGYEITIHYYITPSEIDKQAILDGKIERALIDELKKNGIIISFPHKAIKANRKSSESFLGQTL
ncbi:MAG: hypothetical protein V3575_07115 [Candidatus Absconditabacteria bacterium]